MIGRVLSQKAYLTSEQFLLSEYAEPLKLLEKRKYILTISSILDLDILTLTTSKILYNILIYYVSYLLPLARK